MVRTGSITLALLAVGLILPAGAQERDARVLDPGRLSLRVGGDATYATSDFVSGGTEPFHGGYAGPLTPTTFAPLAGFASNLGGFFAATEGLSGGGPTDPADVIAGTLGVEIGWNARAIPVALGVGVFPRVELTVDMAVYRNERYTRRYDISGGNVGINPDVVGNGELLESISPDFVGLGGSTIMPVAGSPIGLELQHRVRTLTGSELALPEAPLTGGNLATAFGMEPLPSLLTPWRPADLEIGARVAVLQTFGGIHPVADGLQYRVAATAALRLPTGERSQEDVLLDRGPDVGFQAVGGGLAADLFVGDRFWISAGAGMNRFGTADVLVAVVPPGGPLAGDVETVVASRERGSEIDLWATPRVRLTREISVGASVRSEHWGEDRYTIDQDIVTPGRSRRSLGISLRYSTLARVEEGDALPAIDVALGYSGAFSGSAGLPVTRRAYVQVSYLPRLWGR